MSTEEPISPCHFFQKQSWYVWNRISFAREMKLRVSETSITEELLYQFYKAFADRSVPIRLFESVNEHKNGSDIEILINTEGGYVLLACQAKITYVSGNYKSFYHEVGGKRQLDLLRDYAKSHGGIAQYLLYNFMPDHRMSEKAAKIKSHIDYGITAVTADLIYDWIAEMSEAGKKPGTPGFNEFHPDIAAPFHQLICAMLRGEKTHISKLTDTKAGQIKYYSDNEVADADSWRQVTALTTIGYVEEKNEVSSVFGPNDDAAPALKQEKTADFKPKFRVVIGGEVNFGQIVSIS